MSSDAAKAQQQQQQGQQVDIATLPVAQLQQLKKQLDGETSHLTTSYSSLRTAQAKFSDCITSVRTALGQSDPTEQQGPKSLLVPLTTSLYVPGTLADADKVLVDVGTGFYVEKSRDEAVKFYEGKVKELGESIGQLGKVIAAKQGNQRVVDEVLRAKMLAAAQQEEGQSSVGR